MILQLLILTFGLLIYVSCDVCHPINGFEGCACRMNDTKEIISLLPLGNNTTVGKPRFITEDPNDDWFYGFQPCGNFTMFLNDTIGTTIPCYTTSAARFTDLSVHQCDAMGTHGLFAIDSNFDSPVVSNKTLTFKNNSLSMVISLVCNLTLELNESIFNYQGFKQSEIQTWYFSLESRCCCENGCPDGLPFNPSQGSKADDTVWNIVGITAGVLFLIILVFVIIYARFYPRANTTEREHLIPKA